MAAPLGKYHEKALTGSVENLCGVRTEEGTDHDRIRGSISFPVRSRTSR